MSVFIFQYADEQGFGYSAQTVYEKAHSLALFEKASIQQMGLMQFGNCVLICASPLV
jgi:hypothetical protein